MRNNLKFGLLTCTVMLIAAMQVSAQNSTGTALFNTGWKFYKGDTVNAQKVKFSDAGWRAVTLPHDWSIEGPFSAQWASGTGFLPGGIGWYRKTFTVPVASRGKKIFIYFDGVYKNSEVWINGHYLGKRPNGFISFQYALSPYLHFGGKNVLAVKVDHSQFADSRWYTGSGIYRNVYLITRQPVHIGLWGVAYSTPQVTAGSAQVKVRVTVVNESAKNAKVSVTCKLVDARHQTVARATKNISSLMSDSTLANLSFTVKDPKLWSVDDPNLYNLVVTLTANGKQTDQWQANAGIRSIEFNADKGFFLNGKNMKLKGVCIHDDAGALGVAVPEAVWYRRLKLLKQGGCNAIRMSHNPHADYFYNLCDELGLLVMDEAFDEWEVGKNKWVQGWNVGVPSKDGYNQYFKDWYAKDTRDMILRDRNHASIIMWSIGNEIDYPNDPYSDSVLSTGRNPQIYGRGYLPDHPPAKRLGELSKLLADVVRQYDSTRFVTAALAGVVMSNTTTFPQNLDAVGYNYQEYRYKEDHKTYPQRVIYGSENGMQLGAWTAVDTNAFISGQFLWTGIDYLGEARQWPSRSSGSGLLDLAGFPKTEYYFRQSLWSDKPMIYIGTADIPKATDNSAPARYRRQAKADWNYHAGDKVRVNCYTNCSQAELFLNGKSLGKKSLSQFNTRVIYWDVDYQSGELMVKGTTGDGREVSYSIKTAGEPYALAAAEDMPARTPGGLSQIVIHVVDRDGLPVYSADSPITVNIAGPAKLLGLESGSLDSHEDYKSNSRKAMNGNLLAYIQPEKPMGRVSVTFQSPGLKPVTLNLGGTPAK